MKALPWLLAVVVPLGSLPSVLTYLGSGCWDCALFRWHRHGSVVRPASLMLQALASAQAEFRANDRDGNGVQDFWRVDVAGLQGLLDAAGRPLDLIELSTAQADDRWVVCPGKGTGPKGGYWIRVLRHADETPGALDPHRFAYCAYPADFPRSGHKTFIMDENSTIFASPFDLVGVPDVFPDEATLRAKWSKLD